MIGAEPRHLIVVLDTNALVRVALAKSPLARALRFALEEGVFILLTSDEILPDRERIQVMLHRDDFRGGGAANNRHA